MRLPERMRPNRNWNRLNTTFRKKLSAVFRDLAGHGVTLMLVEGWRSTERQIYLYAQGRKNDNAIVTNHDGVKKRSYHQTGCAADVYFVKEGVIYLPKWDGKEGTIPPEFALLRSSANAHELEWGGNWKMRDTPHLEWRRKD